ncbi:MAG: 4-hydroxy-2-oxovalerate aldolase [Lachnospiraceae bacterium]|nr:4-hydroxy-2-oxovalerate aldolase [Lachnospiraceae bacterium]
MNRFTIMDVTMRDGSYAVNFQFSLSQQRLITTGIEDLGFEYIEIGHGMGLGASSPENGIALHTDEEYLDTARKSLKKAKYGTFCIPGIAKLEDVEKAASYGAGFLRFGTNVTDVKNSEPYIKKARDLGIIPMANLMKSYALKPEELADKVAEAESFGAECVYIVDSAGCMLPDDIKRCYEAIRKVTDVKLGFHGHDNLGLVLWNSFTAIEQGFEFIDCTLQGIGRSSGNAPLEMMCINAKKMGYDLDVDLIKLLNLGKKYVYPLCHRYNSIDTMCGVSGMHTGFLGSVRKVSGEYGVNPLSLIDMYSDYSRIKMDADKLEEMAKTLPQDEESLVITDFNGYFGHGQY